MKPADDDILCVNFNQDHSCFAVGTQTGFQIFSSIPFKQLYSRDLGGGIGFIQMLYKSNIVALVGGGKSPKFPLNKLILWDDHQLKQLGEMSFRSEVKSVKMKADRIIVALQGKIFVYNFSDLQLLDHAETCPNPLGLVSVNTEGESTILAYLDQTVGHVNVNFYDKKMVTQIKAHQSALNCMQLNSKATQVATASIKGTVIRIFDTQKGTLLQELRRGTEYAQIFSVSFDHTGQFLASSSDSGTIHIFSLQLTKEEQQENQKNNTLAQGKNPKSQFSFLQFIAPILDSEWSFSQYRIVDSKSKVVFAPEYGLIVVSYEGNFYKVKYNPETGGDCADDIKQKLFKDDK